MLVLSRKVGEMIQIGDNIKIVVQRIQGRHVGLGIEAPRDVHVLRGELERREPIARQESAGSEEAA